MISGLAGAPPTTAGTPSLLKAINERSVLDCIQRQGPMSRADVARESGLSKPTVSLALSGLLEAGLVREVGRSHGGRGPSGTPTPSGFASTAPSPRALGES